jgi:hypothetical protein
VDEDIEGEGGKQWPR